MSLTREQKESIREGYEQGLALASNVFLVDYKGVSVPEITDLRNRVRDAGGEYIVVKNRLVRRVIQDASLSALEEHFRGSVGVAFGEGDPVDLARALSDFAKDVPEFELKAGIVEGQTVESEQIKEIASLPSREDLLTKLVFLLQSPITNFVRTLGAIPRSFVVVLDQIRLKKEEQGEG